MKTNPVVVGARAIDVGYFNVKHTHGRTGGADGMLQVASFPSVAPVLKSGVARQADGEHQPEGCVVPVNGVSYFVGPGAAQRGNGQESRIVADDYAASDKYLALLRGALWRIADGASAGTELVVRRLALGLPLTTYFEASELLAKRAAGEHLIGPVGNQRRVVVEKVRVIVQPQGAIINFGYLNGGKPLQGLTMVIDPGGGTLDWYLSEGTVPYWERSGAYPKAMLACAYAVADRINPRWRNQAAIIDRIDQAIRDQKPSFSVQGQEYPMTEYRRAVDQILDEAIDQMLTTVGVSSFSVQ